MDFSKYNNEETGQFREDAIREVGLWGHPEADTAYQRAWKNGHEGGLPEVFSHLDDIANAIFDGRVDA